MSIRCFRPIATDRRERSPTVEKIYKIFNGFSKYVTVIFQTISKYVKNIFFKKNFISFRVLTRLHSYDDYQRKTSSFTWRY